MEHNAKQFLKRISELASTMTDKKISQVAHSSKYNEWHSYICQSKPHWEDITWRVKDPNLNGDTEVHLGFYTSKSSVDFYDIVDKAEFMAKGKCDSVLKNQNGIRLIWSVNLNDKEKLDKIFLTISSILPDFLTLAISQLCQGNSNENTEVHSEEMFVENFDTNVDGQLFPSKIIDTELAKILEYYSTDTDKLAEKLKEVNDKYGFDYGGWIYSSSYDDIFDELQKIKFNFPSLFNVVESSIQVVINSESSESEKWFKIISIVANELENLGGKLITTLTPNGGSDYSFLAFSDKQYYIPILLLYHFNETINNASGWFEEFIEDYNQDYSSFLEKNNIASEIDCFKLEYSVDNGFFGVTINSNVRALNVTNEIYNASIAGMMAAKKYC